MNKFLKFCAKYIFIFIAMYAVVVAVRVFALGERFDVDLITDTTTLGFVGLGYACYILYVLLRLGDDKKEGYGGYGDSDPGKIDIDGKKVDQYAKMRWVTDKELATEKKFGFNYYSDLARCKNDGVLIRSELRGNRLLTNMYKPIHTLILGTTGSGKTEGFVIPSINVLSSCASKPSLVITDPKGELLKKTGRKLTESGYEIKVLNLREPQKSTCWNPMDDAYVMFHKAHSLDSEVTTFRGINPADTKFKHISAEYNNEWYGYNGIAYPNKEMLNNDLDGQKQKLISDADNILHGIASTLCPVVNEKDPTWERGAQDFIWGTMYAMLEDSLDKNTGMTREKFNLYNVNKIVTRTDMGDDPYVTTRNYLLMREKTSPVIARVSSAINNAPNTVKNYMGIVNSAVSLFTDMGIAFATSKNEMNFDTFSSKPTALIIIVPDDDMARHPIATMLIGRIYQVLVDQANKRPTQELERHVYFILDEFANLPKINNLSTLITVSRSRGIFFEMVVQSYSQLTTKYGESDANTIKGNCNIQIYIGSEDMNTKKQFSELCGETYGTSVNVSKNKGKDDKSGSSTSTSKNVAKRPLIYPDELGVLPKETAIVKIFGEYPLKIKLNHAYKYPMFTRVPLEEKYAPTRRLNEAEVLYDIGAVVNARRNPPPSSIFDDDKF